MRSKSTGVPFPEPFLENGADRITTVQVATFCNNIANNLPIQVNDRETELELLYIDDLVEEMLDALQGKEDHREYQGAGSGGR